MKAHDAISDEPGLVVCNCGRRFAGVKARETHEIHWQLERARAALRGGEDSSDTQPT